MSAKNTKDKPRLTVKQTKFVANKVKGMAGYKAYTEAGYKANSYMIAASEASKLTKKPTIQAAIDSALESHGATPEFAVGRLKQIAEQNKEIGAARLASKDILELHGWQRGDRPTVSLQIGNAFFGDSRKRTEGSLKDVIDQEDSTSIEV